MHKAIHFQRESHQRLHS